MAQITLNSSGVASNGSLLLQSNGTTTAVTVDASQNVGIGVTPSAWGSSYKVLQLPGGNIGAFSTTAITTFQNAYDSGTGSYVYLTTAEASRYTQSQGQHQWFNAASGTAGNTITFTQAMTLDASGRLGIGTLSPAGRLDLGVVTASASNQTVITSTNATDASFEVFLRTNVTTIQAGGTGNLAFSNGGSGGTERARITSGGDLLVGTTTAGGAGFTLADAKYIWSLGTYNNLTAAAANMVVASNGSFARSTSALKYKQDIRNLEAIDISKLRPVRYKSNLENDDQTKDHIGFIADEISDLGLIEIVNYGETGEVEGLQYERITAILVKAMQEQQAIITQLQADVAALKGTA